MDSTGDALSVVTHQLIGGTGATMIAGEAATTTGAGAEVRFTAGAAAVAVEDTGGNATSASAMPNICSWTCAAPNCSSLRISIMYTHVSNTVSASRQYMQKCPRISVIMFSEVNVLSSPKDLHIGRKVGLALEPSLLSLQAERTVGSKQAPTQDQAFLYLKEHKTKLSFSLKNTSTRTRS